jgi:hypothetical protein
LTKVFRPPPHPPPSSVQLIISDSMNVSVPPIAPAPPPTPQEEVPCTSSAEVPCASACRPKVGAGLSPPYPNSDELPTTQGLPVVWDDRDPLVQVAIAWDTSVLSHLHTTKALDAALVEWDLTCMGSFDHMATQLPFRDNVPPGKSVVCGLWAQTASCPVALLAEIVQLAFGHRESLACVTSLISKADLVDFLTTPHVHAPCARNSLSHHSMRRMDGISSLADVAAAFHLDTVVWIHSVFCIVGLLNRDARV